tara:strand:+ start:479 stop:2227 length:1749 start_codon:yes stop_codon:yes gene_type:complete
MIEKIKRFQKIELILVILLIFLFFITRLNIIDYGLPFFQQEDENAFLKNTIFYISFVTGIKTEMSDPFLAPLINLLLTLKILFVNEFIMNASSLSEIKQKVYDDPSIMIVYGRYISLTITSLSFFLIYLIFKKLKINFFIYFPLLISLSFSLFTTPISLVNGKNSYYLFFFISQLYFLIKYYFKLEKFNRNTYFLFSILAAFAWGVNYWGAIVSIYGICILHFKKFKLKNLQYLIYFSMGLTVFGILPSLFIEEYYFFSFLIEGHSHQIDQSIFSIYEFLSGYLEKIWLSIQIIFYTEVFVTIYLSLFLFYFFKSFDNKKIIFLLSLLILEPILIMSLAGDEVVPELRYFSGLICLMFILTALIIKDISSYYKSKSIILIFALINIAIVYPKIINHTKLSNVFLSNHTFNNFYEKNKNINQNILYLIPNLDNRKNFKNLDFYKNLHENNIIKNKDVKKDNYESILKKIKIQKDSKLNFKNKMTLDLNTFNMALFEIKNLEIFFNEVKKKYRFVSIEENNLEYNHLYSYIRSNYYKIDQQFDNKNLQHNSSLRDVVKFLYYGGSPKKLSNFVHGNNYSLYKLD